MGTGPGSPELAPRLVTKRAPSFLIQQKPRMGSQWQDPVTHKA